MGFWIGGEDSRGSETPLEQMGWPLPRVMDEFHRNHLPHGWRLPYSQRGDYEGVYPLAGPLARSRGGKEVLPRRVAFPVPADWNEHRDFSAVRRRVVKAL